MNKIITTITVLIILTTLSGCVDENQQTITQIPPTETPVDNYVDVIVEDVTNVGNNWKEKPSGWYDASGNEVHRFEISKTTYAETKSFELYLVWFGHVNPGMPILTVSATQSNYRVLEDFIAVDEAIPEGYHIFKISPIFTRQVTSPTNIILFPPVGTMSSFTIKIVDEQTSSEGIFT